MCVWLSPVRIRTVQLKTRWVGVGLPGPPPPPAFPVARCPAGDDAHLCSSLEDALQRTLTLPDVDRVFVIGGAEVYRQCLARTGHGSAPPPCVPCVGWAASL